VVSTLSVVVIDAWAADLSAGNLVRGAPHRARADAQRLRHLFDAGHHLVDGALERRDRRIQHLPPGLRGIDGRVLMQRHRRGDVEADRLGDDFRAGGYPGAGETCAARQPIERGAKYHVAGDHPRAGRNPDLVFLLAQRPAGLDVALTELPGEHQRKMLLLDPANEIAVSPEHRRHRRHLRLRLDEGVDAFGKRRLDHGPELAQTRTGRRVEIVELEPRLEIRWQLEAHGDPSAAAAEGNRVPDAALCGKCLSRLLKNSLDGKGRS
jgi:hypothetical protein